MMTAGPGGLSGSVLVADWAGQLVRRGEEAVVAAGIPGVYMFVGIAAARVC